MPEIGVATGGELTLGFCDWIDSRLWSCTNLVTCVGRDIGGLHSACVGNCFSGCLPSYSRWTVRCCWGWFRSAGANYFRRWIGSNLEVVSNSSKYPGFVAANEVCFTKLSGVCKFLYLSETDRTSNLLTTLDEKLAHGSACRAVWGGFSR